MARKKGAPSRMDLRRQAEALEAKERTEGAEEGEEVEEGEEEEGDEPDAEVAEDGDEDGEAPKAKPKKVAVKKPAVKRTRTPKEVRMKAIWVVFDNGSKRIDTYPFAQKADAEAALAKKQEEKKGTFYLQLVKEPLDS
ncbi:hypothetical protein [Fimbriiglobus ruber]|uniref:Uncharacterized protein n=1 Tax=Fimbriiglobus ruber TaxID=1908690 RepID=A0A225DVL3_9BACT|nr:hypothetical protein [Fimbriiglobus ruber]OWK41676.1 hypothetical protein FRUB_03754 [Fimbriiglobus ruber]